MSFMQVRLPIYGSIKVVPDILSGVLAPIARYLLLANSDIWSAITWFEGSDLLIIMNEVALVVLQQANVDILIDHN